MCVQLVAIPATGPLPEEVTGINFMIASGADFPLDRIHEIFAAGKNIKVRSRQIFLLLLYLRTASCGTGLRRPSVPLLYCLWEAQPEAPAALSSAGCT